MTRPLRRIISAMHTYREGDNPVYGETAIKISVQEECCGWYFEIEAHDGQKISVELDELRMLLECAEELAKQGPPQDEDDEP